MRFSLGPNKETRMRFCPPRALLAWRRCVALGLVAGALWAQPAAALSTSVPYAVLLDVPSGLVLFEKNADAATGPASLTKLMTALLTFDALTEGRVTSATRFPVSWRSWEAGTGQIGSATMFLSVGEKVRVQDLLKGLLVTSGNDAAVALAEGIAGSEEAFVREMNWRARQLGMTQTFFVNASGLPDPAQYSSVRDLALLARTLITEYPQYYGVFSELWFEWSNIRQKNRLDFSELKPRGIDGLKTGYTAASGYNVILSSARDAERRLILVLSGARSHDERMREGMRLMDWGFRNFVLKTLAPPGAVLGELPVWHGAQETVKLAAAMPVRSLLPSSDSSRFSAHILYNGPVVAPVEKGAVLARLVIAGAGLEAQTTALLAAENVARGGFWTRVQASAQRLVQRLRHGGEIP